MAQSAENSYFALTNPSLKPVPLSNSHNNIRKSRLLNRRQQNYNYLPQLELPSLPPLSHLMNDGNGKEVLVKNEDGSTNDIVSAVAVGMMPHYSDNNPNNNAYYNTNQHPTTVVDTTTTTTTTTNNNNNPANTTSMAHLMGPDAVAAAVALNNTTMMPLDSMYTATTIPPPPPITAPNMMFAPNAISYNNNNNSNNNQNIHMQQQKSNTSSNQRARQLSSSSTSSNEKIYSFVAIPGINQKKRPRRRYDEIERLYQCNWSGCSKAYGTLNHLNAHVSMQKHGSKRNPTEFKEMRKEWRRQKKERDVNKKSNEEVEKQHVMQQHYQQPRFTATAATAPTLQPHFGAQMTLNGFY